MLKIPTLGRLIYEDQEVKASLDQLRLTDQPTYQMFQFKKKLGVAMTLILALEKQKDLNSRRSCLQKNEKF